MQLLSNGRLGAMSWIDDRFLGQGQQFALNALNQPFPVAAHLLAEVRASDAPIEQDIAREEQFLFGQIVTKTVETMPGNVQYLDGCISEGNLIPLLDILHDGRDSRRTRQSEHHGLMLGRRKFLVVFQRSVRHQPKLLRQISASQHVVQMAMRQEQQRWGQSSSFQPVFHLVPFSEVAHARIDDDTLFRHGIVQYIRIFLKRIEDKALNFHRDGMISFTSAIRELISWS